ncbi:MAG: protein-L-isoaspartate O-methyltransferase, partial [Rhodospirillaceae bacterium]
MRDRLLPMVRNFVLAAAVLMPARSAGAVDANGYVEQRQRMVQEIADLALELGRETGRPRFSSRTLEAMMRVPRHRFVVGDESAAYANRALLIGSGQTISQPYIVALMTDLLDLSAGDRVLEIGTGSGYQAAVLAQLAATVYTIEIIEPLARAAAQRLSELGYRNVLTRVGDGYEGWPQHAPYDAIIVTAAPLDVPAPLLA